MDLKVDCYMKLEQNKILVYKLKIYMVKYFINLGARPQCVKFQTNRTQDPLDPIYKLPYSQQKPFSPTKYLKENKFAN